MSRSPHFRRVFILLTTVGLFFCGAESTRANDAPIDADVLKKVKAATVFLQVTLPDSSVVQGSGFFAVENNVVLTNAHVLGMLRPESRRPLKVEIVVNSGEKNEKTYPGEVLGVDRSTDLAVLRVSNARELPAPLKVSSARDLTETQSVFVVGFPFGARLGKNITVSTSSVSSLRKNSLGTIHQVQVNGGMHPGNSGGPVVDEKGNVVGVAVSGLKGTQINFAVPGDYVHVILNGRIISMGTGDPFLDGKTTRAPVAVQVLDPLQRMKKISIDFWTGAPGKPRSASTEEPQPREGDSPRQRVELEYTKEKGEARGAVTLPPLENGKAYWLQPVFINGAGETHWVSAGVYKPAPTLDRTPLTLKYQQVLGAKTRVDLNTDATFKLRDAEGQDHTVTMNLAAQLTETASELLDTDDNVPVKVRYDKFNLGVQIDKEPLPRSKVFEDLAANIRTFSGELRIDPQGSMTLNKVPDNKFKGRDSDLYDIHMQVLQSLQTVSLPLPGKQISHDKPWKAQRVLWLSLVGPSEKGVADITYTFAGTHQRDGRDEVHIDLTGTIRGPKDNERKMGGRIGGYALLDGATGQLFAADLSLDVDLDSKLDGKAVRLSGTLDIRLRRSAIKAPKD